MPADPIRARSLFLGAIDLPDTTQRNAYLDQECANDAALRAQVEGMLRLDAVLAHPST